MSDTKYLLPSPILLNKWSILGIGYDWRSPKTLLRVLLKLAITQIYPFFLWTENTGLLKPLGLMQLSIIISVVMHFISASMSASRAWVTRCCFLGTELTISRYMNSSDKTAFIAIFSTDNVGIANKQVCCGF